MLQTKLGQHWFCTKLFAMIHFWLNSSIYLEYIYLIIWLETNYLA